MRIGFFDSGLGGLTILEAVRKCLPEYDYLFFGDTLHVPYGGRSEEEVYSLTKAAVIHLFNEGALLVIIACNTASAETLRRLQETILTNEYASHRILGVIVPTVEVLVEKKYKKILLIGTERTVQSKKYEKELSKRSDGYQTIMGYPTPGLVPLIEAARMDEAAVQMKSYLTNAMGEVGVLECIVLGCTHYTLLKKAVRVWYPEISIIAQDEIIPEKLSKYLETHGEIRSKLTQRRELVIQLSKDTPEYEIATTWLLNSGE